MSRKSRETPQDMQSMTELEPKYPKPKTLLIDLDKDVALALKEAGYNISTGSFGTPYKVKKADRFVPLRINGSIPVGYKEQEIVIVDLHSAILEEPPQHETLQLRGQQWFAKTDLGVVDPRPRLALAVKEDFDRISQHGGVFVIFASPAFPHELKLQDGSPLYASSPREEFYDIWDFLSDLNTIHIEDDNGEEIQIANNIGLRSELLGTHLSDAHFECILRPGYVNEEDWWFPLATNKFGAAVAGIMFRGKVPYPRFIFIFPQLRDKASFLTAFLSEVLPEYAPHLFPYFEGAKWVHRPEYELPKVRELQQHIQEVRETADGQIQVLTDAITEVRNANDYLYKLLTASGDELVWAVEIALQKLGFTSITNVDEQAKAAGDTSPKREDLQIHDNSPIILVEVKGISHLPRDADALQVWKYIAPRMKEWDRTDIRGLAIVNHQKNLPPLQRENDNVFREDVIITNAVDNDFGLMTTWNLFRLVRSFLSNDWSHDQIKSIFYQNGQIAPIPNHYEEIGIIEHVWPKAQAFGVIVQNQAINLGDKIAFEFPVEFKEQIVQSLQQEKQAVETVNPDDLAGIQTSLIEQGLRKGIKVYKVNEVP